MRKREKDRANRKWLIDRAPDLCSKCKITKVSEKNVPQNRTQFNTIF